MPLLVQSIPYIFKLILGLNLLISGYMWVGAPIVVNVNFPDGSGIAGISSGPFIVINTDYAEEGTADYEEVFRHEYTHYIQTMVYTPLGTSAYSTYRVVSNFIKYGPKNYFFLYYKDNALEEQAFEYQYDEAFKLPKNYFKINLRLNW